MEQLEKYFTTEFLRDFNPEDYIKYEIIDEATGETKYVRYHVDGVNVALTYVEPDIEEFKALVFANTVIEPISWLVKIQPAIGVSYSKYLYVKASQSKLKNNKHMYKKVMKLWKLMGNDK
ncbi:hypothetical protein [Bacillus wiedmannii]|uniref:hypothetical protein n=1 Tax=Bacillus wiedmannii TaxID=1890302 RepID=UPI00094B5CF4|nr:hypothetical protein [Bacillus wiedmannii]